MDKGWLWLLLGLLLLLAGLGGLWLRKRRPPARRAGGRGQQPAAPPPATAAPAPRVDSTVADAEAQRLAATEALRQARRRKAEAQAQAQAQVVAPRAPLAPRAPPAPAATPIPLPAPRLVPALSPSGPPAKPPAARPLAPPTVLLVDDSKLVRVKTGRLLQQLGWQVLLAEDGLAALSQLEQAVIDLVITDVEMPGLDGFELTRRVRADARWQALPVIMITASDDKHQATARAAGVDLVLGKPYADETLLAQAQRLVGRAAGASGWVKPGDRTPA